MSGNDWPELPFAAWRATRDTLHMYLQVIGKVRLALAPMEPQWAQVPLYVTARGLNTSPIPHPFGVFDIDVDLVDHVVSVRSAAGGLRQIALEPRAVADFYDELMDALASLGLAVTITTLPQEVPDPIPFPEDRTHTSYEPEWANRFWRVLVSVDSVFKEHRARFQGKVSPIQFFWGALDLSYMRFSGRPAEPPPDADVITRYSSDAEHVCAGFWPGDTRLDEPAFFAYASPAPPGIDAVGIEPADARWSGELGEFVLPYDAVRSARDPRGALFDFLDTTYTAAAGLARWDPALTHGRRLRPPTPLSSPRPRTPLERTAMTTYKVGYFVGSLSSTSINRVLSRVLIRLAPEELEFTEIGIGNLPLYSPDFDSSYPPEAVALKEAITRSDAILFVTPEYNRSIPGALKNAIDWASRPWGQNAFDNMPAAVIGASVGRIGTAMAQQSLRGVLGFCNARQMTAPEAYIQYSPEIFTDDGEVTNDSTKDFLSHYMREFHAYILRVLTVLPRE